MSLYRTHGSGPGSGRSFFMGPVSSGPVFFPLDVKLHLLKIDFEEAIQQRRHLPTSLVISWIPSMRPHLPPRQIPLPLLSLNPGAQRPPLPPFCSTYTSCSKSFQRCCSLAWPLCGGSQLHHPGPPYCYAASLPYSAPHAISA